MFDVHTIGWPLVGLNHAYFSVQDASCVRMHCVREYMKHSSITGKGVPNVHMNLANSVQVAVTERQVGGVSSDPFFHGLIGLINLFRRI